MHKPMSRQLYMCSYDHLSETSEQIMATPADQSLFSNDLSVAGLSLTTINSNLVEPMSSLDEATSTPLKLDNRAYPEKSPSLIDGHDDDDDDDDDDEHGDGSNEWGCGDVTAEYDGSKEDSHGLVRCSSAASVTSNYIHSMGESSGSAPGQNMDHTGVEEVWTNEKHNAYLDSMEDNFVRDMYTTRNYCSLELCANQHLHSQSESEAESECESEARMVYRGTSSDIMDELEESESESSVVYSSTIIDEIMTTEDAPECMDGSISSSSSSCLRRKGGNRKEKGSSHTTSTSPSTKTAWKRRTPPSFASSGPSNRKNIVQRYLPEMDIARLHEHASTLTNPTIDSNAKKRACAIESPGEESSMKTLKLAGKKRPFLSSYCDQVVPSIGSHQDSQDMMQDLAKITKAEVIGLGSTTKPLSQFSSYIGRT